MDRLDAPVADLSRNLSDIARLNRIGATQTIQRSRCPVPRPVSPAG